MQDLQQLFIQKNRKFSTRRLQKCPEVKKEKSSLIIFFIGLCHSCQGRGGGRAGEMGGGQGVYRDIRIRSKNEVNEKKKLSINLYSGCDDCNTIMAKNVRLRRKHWAFP